MCILTQEDGIILPPIARIMTNSNIISQRKEQ